MIYKPETFVNSVRCSCGYENVSGALKCANSKCGKALAVVIK